MTKPVETTVSIGRLVPGKRYRVQFEDCCTQGFFTAVFERYELDEDGDPYEAFFDGARLGQLWAGYEAVEAPDGEPTS